MYKNVNAGGREELTRQGYRSIIDLAAELSGNVGGPKLDSAINYLIRLRGELGLCAAKVLNGTQSYYSETDANTLRKAWKEGRHLKLDSDERRDR